MNTPDIILTAFRTSRRVEIDKISHVRYECFICVFTLVDGSIVKDEETLSYYASQLERHRFFRIHRNVVVNMKHVAHTTRLRSKKHILTMKDGSVLNIAYRRWPAFNEAFAHEAIC